MSRLKRRREEANATVTMGKKSVRVNFDTDSQTVTALTRLARSFLAECAGNQCEITMGGANGIPILAVLQNATRKSGVKMKTVYAVTWGALQNALA